MGETVSCPHQRLLEVKQLLETVCTGEDALLLPEALSISLSVLWNSSGRHSAYLHLHMGSCLGLNWRSCRHPTLTEGHRRCQGQLPIAAWSFTLKDVKGKSFACLLQYWQRQSLWPLAPISTRSLFLRDPCSCSFQLAQGQSWHLLTETMLHYAESLCICAGMSPNHIWLLHILIPWVQDHTGHVSPSILQEFFWLIFTFPFNFPSETPFRHFFSTPVFYLVSLSLSPSLLHTQQRGTHRKSFVVALTLFHTTTKQQTNRWKKRRVMVWGILVYQIKP